MARRIFLMLFLAFSAVVFSQAEGGVVVLGETPVAEFTLPDGSVIKNAFVWRRSSEGLMIVHDDGQYFLNFQLLSDDWKAAYQGEPDVKDLPEEAQIDYEVADPYRLMPILETIPGLTESGRSFVLRKDADENSEKYALALGILHSLLTGKADDAKRLILVVEEKGVDIESVERDALFVECGACDGKGRIDQDCSTCNGTGDCPKCNGEGKRASGIGKKTMHCTTCRGTGKCRDCAGNGSNSIVCRTCRGRGKLLEKRYCEVKRDLYVHTVNRAANPDLTASVTQSDRDAILKVLKTVPELEPRAPAYFASDRYTGGMDSNILVACVLNSLLQGNMENAERFVVSLNVNYGESKVLEIGKYLKTCETCEGKGSIDRDCKVCSGSGDCKRCGGDGERDSEFMDKTIPCTTCRGNGKCTACQGVGSIKVRCSTCGGTGRKIEKDRARIKLELVVAELNQYYLENQ